jgi:hypothetical protein
MDTFATLDAALGASVPPQAAHEHESEHYTSAPSTPSMPSPAGQRLKRRDQSKALLQRAHAEFLGRE